MLDILERRNEYIMSTCLIHSIDRSISITVPNLPIVYLLAPFASHVIQNYEPKTEKEKIRIYFDLPPNITQSNLKFI